MKAAADHISDQTDYWNRAAGEKEFSLPLGLERFAGLVEKSEPVLDLGCGYGRVIRELADAGYGRVVGLDTSSGMIERGRKAWPDLDLRVWAGGRLPYDDSAFGAVVLVAVLTSAPLDRDQALLINEARRALKPGGHLFLVDFLIQDDQRNRQRYEAFADKYGCYGMFELPEGAVLRHHDPAHIHTLTKDFRPVEWRELTVTTMNKHQALAFSYIGQK